MQAPVASLRVGFATHGKGLKDVEIQKMKQWVKLQPGWVSAS